MYFENRAARKLWNGLKALVEANLHSSDVQVQLSARGLHTYMQGIEASKYTLSLNVGKQNGTVTVYGGAKTYEPWGGLFNNNARVIIDDEYTQRRFSLAPLITLAHEIGHAWAIMTDQHDKVTPAIVAENDARVLNRCAPNRVSEQQLPPPCNQR